MRAAAQQRCTIAQANIRACASLDCAKLFTYEPDTLLVIDQSSSTDDEWLIVTDPLTHIQGFISSSLVSECDAMDWQLKPVVPQTVSQKAKEIYKKGLANGNYPHTFSKVGDCQNVEYFFLGAFDDPTQYNLGQYTSLSSTIEQFKGSFSRKSASVNHGFNIASVLSPIWSPGYCEKNETPLECEYRLNKPSIVIISMETWWTHQPASEYENYLRQVVQFWVDRSVVPILGTKADNLEHDHGINASIARVATEFDVPLWNFWLAVQPLPSHGLGEDGFHLLFAQNDFSNETKLRTGWPVRNLTALQALDAVWNGLNTKEN